MTTKQVCFVIYFNCDFKIARAKRIWGGAKGLQDSRTAFTLSWRTMAETAYSRKNFSRSHPVLQPWSKDYRGRKRKKRRRSVLLYPSCCAHTLGGVEVKQFRSDLNTLHFSSNTQGLAFSPWTVVPTHLLAKFHLVPARKLKHTMI